MKQIDIQKLIRLMEDGYVAMDKDGVWYWHEEEPYIEENYWINDGQLTNLECFNIAPVSDWTKSLIKVENKDE